MLALEYASFQISITVTGFEQVHIPLLNMLASIVFFFALIIHSIAVHVEYVSFPCSLFLG